MPANRQWIFEVKPSEIYTQNKSNIRFFLKWPWPRHHDLYVRIWYHVSARHSHVSVRHCKSRPTINCLYQGFQKLLYDRQSYRQAPLKRIPWHFTGGNNKILHNCNRHIHLIQQFIFSKLSSIPLKKTSLLMVQKLHVSTRSDASSARLSRNATISLFAMLSDATRYMK